MTVKVHGNVGTTNIGAAGVSGVGQRSIPDGTISWVGVSASAANDVALLKAITLTSADKVQQGYFFQAPAGATVEFTLAPGEQAVNADPVVQAGVPWGNSLTVSSTIVKAPVCFTAVRISFTAPGMCYIVAR